MSQTDPVGDMLAMFHNAALRKKPRVAVPHSRMKEGVCRVLKEEGYVQDVQVVETPSRTGKPRRALHVYLRYDGDRRPMVRGLRRVSRPGCRVFRGVDDLGKVLDGLGISVLSTSRGLMSDRRARKERVGGEVICKVW